MVVASILKLLPVSDKELFAVDEFKENFVQAVIENKPFEITINTIPHWSIVLSVPSAIEYEKLEGVTDNNSYLDALLFLSIKTVIFKSNILYVKKQDDVNKIKEEVLEVLGKQAIFPIIVKYWFEFMKLYKKLLAAVQEPDFFVATQK